MGKIVSEEKRIETEIYSLITKYCDDFIEKNNYSFVVEKSIPIIWFGNIKKYFESKIRIVTISLNPSLNEFPEKERQRFNDIAFIKDAIIKKNYPYTLMMENYNNYFKNNPYIKWFKWYEKQLNEIDGSYYDNKKENTAIHIDIHSAIATDPKWGDLKVYQKQIIQNTGLFRELLQLLNPNIAMISVAKQVFESIVEPGLPIKEWGYKHKKIKLYKKGSILFLFGVNMKGQPFGACNITNEIKNMIFDYLTTI